MMTPSSSSDIQLGDKALLTCNYDGSPPPTAQWFHNGTLLSDGTDTGVNIIGGAYKDSFTAIQVAHVSRNSGGTYTCNVTNSAKSVKVDIVLRILGEFNKYRTCMLLCACT